MLLFYALWHNGLSHAKTSDGDVFFDSLSQTTMFLEKIGTPITAGLVASPTSSALFFKTLLYFSHTNCVTSAANSAEAFSELKNTTIASEMAFNRSTSRGSGFSVRVGSKTSPHPAF